MARNSRRRRAGLETEQARRGPTPRASGSHVDGDAGAHLDRLLSWSGTKINSNGSARLLKSELSGLSAAELGRLDEVTSARLVSAVDRLWELGWQPRDLLHVAGRIDAWSAALAGDVAVEQVRRSGRHPLATRAWREQLDAAAERARAADIGRWSTRDDWLAVDRLVAAGVPAVTAWSSAIRLLARLGELPRTLPPPSAWRAEPRPASTPRTPPPRAATPPAEPSQSPSRDKVLTTIRALLAKAESTQFAAEAEALSAKAQALMTRHAIDEALLHQGDLDSVEVVSRRVLIDSPYPVEKVHLLSAVGRANRTRVVWLDELAMATIVGTPVDVDQVELLFVSLLIQSTRAMAEAGTAQPGSFDRSPRFRRSFLMSYA
ncbi:MAG TPA: DUF2786 domain-containing protein, partial [Microlunatus sp.]|nr:DUF2786 domain-containing protein [Microlunatus sp.]